MKAAVSCSPRLCHSGLAGQAAPGLTGVLNLALPEQGLAVLRAGARRRRGVVL